jgi:hypothetical protein
MSPNTILLVAALVAFVLAAVGWSYKKTDLIGVGLACAALSVLIDRIQNLTLSTIILILAFIVFVLAAIGWNYKKTKLISVGLALWVLSILSPLVIK